MEDGLPFSAAEPNGIVFVFLFFFHLKLAIYRTTPVLGTGHLFCILTCLFWAEAMGSAGGKRRRREPEQSESRVEGNLETNLATITTRI